MDHGDHDAGPLLARRVSSEARAGPHFPRSGFWPLSERAVRLRLVGSSPRCCCRRLRHCEQTGPQRGVARRSGSWARRRDVPCCPTWGARGDGHARASAPKWRPAPRRSHADAGADQPSARAPRLRATRFPRSTDPRSAPRTRSARALASDHPRPSTGLRRRERCSSGDYRPPFADKLEGAGCSSSGLESAGFVKGLHATRKPGLRAPDCSCRPSQSCQPARRTTDDGGGAVGAA